MGLGAPLALLLLGALVLPWLAHRMRQRDVPTVILPTIALLQQAMVVTQRRRALQDLLLMLTRMALIVLLALGLAAPFLWGPVSVGDGQPQSLAIVIDDSMSMQRSHGGESLWHVAKQRALTAIAQLPATSQVAVIAAGRPARALATLGAPEHAIAILTRFEPSPARGTALSPAVDLASAMLAAAQHEQRRVWVLSDFVGHGAVLEEPGSDVALQAELIGTGKTERNIAITHAHVERDPDNHGHRVSVQARVFQGASPPVLLRARVGDRVVHEAQLAFASDQQAKADLVIGAGDTGDHERITLELVTDDSLTIDDRRDVLLRDERVLRVLLINGDPRPTHSSDELHFLSRALPLRSADAAPLAMESLDALGLAQAPLDNVDLVWLANVEVPSDAVVARLRTYVEAGGALMASMGDRMEPALANARFGALLPARLESIEQASGVTFASIGVAPDPWGIAVGDVGAAGVTQRVLSQANGHVALRFSDGVPALLHHSVGRGRVALWTTSIDGDWTDLPYRPGYLALTLSLVDALTHAPSTSKVHEPGDVVPLAIPSGVVDATLIDPNDTTHALPLDHADMVASAAQTQLPGAYQVRVTDDNGHTRMLSRSAFVVAAPSDESDLTPSPPPITRAPTSTPQLTRVRQPLDQHIFAWLPVLLLLETILRTQRSKPAASNAA